MSKSEYAMKMARLSKQIFGEIVTTTDQKSMKVVQIHQKLPAHKNPEYVNYYPQLRPLTRLMEALRKEGLYRYLHFVLAYSYFVFLFLTLSLIRQFCSRRL